MRGHKFYKITNKPWVIYRTNDIYTHTHTGPPMEVSPEELYINILSETSNRCVSSSLRIKPHRLSGLACTQSVTDKRPGIMARGGLIICWHRQDFSSMKGTAAFIFSLTHQTNLNNSLAADYMTWLMDLSVKRRKMQFCPSLEIMSWSRGMYYCRPLRAVTALFHQAGKKRCMWKLYKVTFNRKGETIFWHIRYRSI